MRNLAVFSILFFTLSSAHGIIGGQLVGSDKDLAQTTVMVISSIKGFSGSKPAGDYDLCTGSLIAQDVIVTAAHCVISEKSLATLLPSKIKIYFGNFDGVRHLPNLMAGVIEVKKSPHFNVGGDAENDIALIRLAQPAPAPFHPIAFLSDPSLLKVDMPVTIAGFGNIFLYDDSREPNSSLLRSFETRIADVQNARSGMINFYSEDDLISKFNVVAAPYPVDHPELKGQAGEAAGDSGGPAISTIGSTTELIAVASGYEGAAPFRERYESVAKHAAWIQSFLRTGPQRCAFY